ncbi:type II secretion system F family protein [Clostridium sp. ZS2-4]|uniref:type II secretion system F family protein n=1 Tax=Clostridium sp. ZS2-4 TaxID=2987703 RepID=UPI00227D19F4|nr:type II secretion system F family protein [Clostridium sp. ZS2-4]MCY6354056.1 type II secretion system F family protein [Clostridium sp. ZS2-4]
MKTYRYKAINIKGDLIKGKYALQNEKELIYIMKDKGYFLLDYGVSYLDAIKYFGHKVYYKDLAIFCKQLSEILKSGIGISKGLDILAYQKINPKISSSLRIAKEDVEKGKYLSESLEKLPDIYPAFMIDMIKIGEQSGNMEKVLFNLYEYYWNQHSVYTKIKSLSIYPIIVLCTTGVITLGIITKIIPVFVNNLMTNNMQVTPEVEKIIKINKFISSKAAKALTVVLGIFLTILKSKGYDKKIFNTIKFFIPGVKSFYEEFYEMRFAKNLSLLISSGVPILAALDIINNPSENPYYREKISRLSINIKEGMSLSKALEKSKLFKKFFVSMIVIGEETGNIDGILNNVAEIYEDNLKSIINKVSSLIEPVTTIVLSIIITFIIIKFIFPIIQLMDSVETIF